MLNVTADPTTRRRQFKADLSSGRLLRVPGAFSPIVAQIIEQLGFDAVYISGAVMAADLGLPDIGLTTLTEVSQRGYQIARVTNLPCFIDIDTGFGEPMSAWRTVREMEALGLAGCHLEDQLAPKRCGHLDNKEVVSVGDMQRRIKAAVDGRIDDNFVLCARTDSRAMEGLDKAIDRAKAYIDAGADMIFPEAMADLSEFEAMRKAIDVPMLANMTEFGKSELFNATQLCDIGINMVIYPVTTLRLALGAVEAGLGRILEDGDQNAVVDVMQTRKRLYEVIRYEEYNQFDQGLFNFAVPGATAAD